MTKTNAELILASHNVETNDTLFTWRLTFPRCILAEVNTHRVASRNTSSSRAIPVKKQREAVLNDPFVPMHIGANKKGMQAGAELEGWKRNAAERLWRAARYPALGTAWLMEKLGVHKQITNRLLEPWQWTVQIFSATELDNFFLLRDHHKAEPHFQELARQMHKQYRYVKESLARPDGVWWDGFDLRMEGRINRLRPGQWHLPLVNLVEGWGLSVDDKKILSAGRCARTSYTQPDDGSRIDLAKATEIVNKTLLADSGPNDPKHLSPLEHQAQAMPVSEFIGNFKGFKQYRKELELTT